MVRCATFAAVAAILAAPVAAPVAASPAEVVAATATLEPSGWRFDVTVRHDDTGWAHYADGWEVVAPDGTRLGTRELLHPHEAEQPFTRSLSGVTIPEGVARVGIRVRDTLTGWADTLFEVGLSR